MAAQPDTLFFSSASAPTDAVPASARPLPRPSIYFCSNPACVFHVRADDPCVKGFGDWAILESGLTVSHRWIRGELLCDLCTRSHRGPVNRLA